MYQWTTYKVHLTVLISMSPGGLSETYIDAVRYVVFFLVVEAASHTSLLVLHKRHMYRLRSKSSIPTQTINLYQRSWERGYETRSYPRWLVITAKGHRLFFFLLLHSQALCLHLHRIFCLILFLFYSSLSSSSLPRLCSPPPPPP
jgi:hypothetical protein